MKVHMCNINNIPGLQPASKLENHVIHQDVDSGEGMYIHVRKEL